VDYRGRFNFLPQNYCGSPVIILLQVRCHEPAGLPEHPRAEINGITEQFGYDAARLQMSSQKAGTVSPYTNRMNLTYSYSAAAGQMGIGTTAGNAGQLMGIVPDVNNNPSTINGTTESAAYTYDNYGRLVTSNQTSNGSSAQQRFVYDRFGNRTAVYDSTSGGNLMQSIALVTSGSAPTNQIASVTTTGTVSYTYDAAGNLTNDGQHTYTYDAENRLVSIDGGAALYRYDSENHRVCKVVGASWTHYVWQGNQVLAEHDGKTAYGNFGDPPYGLRSAKVDYLYAGSRLMTSYQWTHTTTCSKGICTTSHTAQAQYYLSDRLSARLVLDASGNVVGRQGHLPFGEDWAESGSQQKQHFTSYERDSKTGTDYAVNRQYNQGVGRFNRVDPRRKSCDYNNPQSINRYSYVWNEPIGRIDPLGLMLTWVCSCVADPTVEPNGGESCTCGWQESAYGNGWYLDFPTPQIDLSDLLKVLDQIAALAEGIGEALQALTTDKCRAYFAGLKNSGAQDPQVVLNDMYNNGQIRIGSEYQTWRNNRFVSLPFDEGDIARTVNHSDPTDSTRFFSTITINSNGSFFSGMVGQFPITGVSVFQGLTLSQIHGAIILHELAHVFGGSHGGSQSDNLAFTEEVVNACFKP
jgi:RHS repeat-associated protein